MNDITLLVIAAEMGYRYSGLKQLDTVGPDGETAYAGGDNVSDGFPNSNDAWWGYVTFTVLCCDVDAEVCQEEVWTLWAEQHNNAGEVSIYNDSDYLFVTYNINESADLGEIHLNIDTVEPDIRLMPGHYNTNGYVEAVFPTDSYTLVVPLSDFDYHWNENGFSEQTEVFLSIEEMVIPEKFSLHQNYPNPFNPRYTYTEDSIVELIRSFN